LQFGFKPLKKGAIKYKFYKFSRKFLKIKPISILERRDYMLTDKTFPLRMSRMQYERLETQALRFGMSITAYIRKSITTQLEIDERKDK